MNSHKVKTLLIGCDSYAFTWTDATCTCFRLISPQSQHLVIALHIEGHGFDSYFMIKVVLELYVDLGLSSTDMWLRLMSVRSVFPCLKELYRYWSDLRCCEENEV